MNIQEVIFDLIHREVILSPYSYEKFTGGTVSEVYLLTSNETKYVVKINEPQIVESEAEFLRFYQGSELLPKLMFVGKANKYIVYSYIDGTTNNIRENKRDMLKALVQGLVNQYKPAPDIGWGWIDQPTDSWESYLKDKIIEASKLVNTRLEYGDHNLVFNILHKINRDRKPFLLHGDCGVHNFIFGDGQLIGVIDPSPVIGDPLYDLIYAFCSSPDDLTKDTIDSAIGELIITSADQFLYSEVLIGLYLRLGACVKHHPQDFEEYLKAWHYWKEVIKTG